MKFPKTIYVTIEREVNDKDEYLITHLSVDDAAPESGKQVTVAVYGLIEIGNVATKAEFVKTQKERG